MSTTSRTLTSALAYTDDQDPSDIGWAYRLRYSDDHEESGPMDATNRAQAKAELRAMIEAAGHTDVTIERDDDGNLTWSA